MQNSVVYRVSSERWNEALEWEREGWIKAQKLRAKYFKNLIWKALSTLRLKPKYRGNDWNDWWKKQFQDYNFLDKNIENAIEVGCGPYTNMRYIIQKCQPKHLFLSDPLMKTYVNFKLTYVSELYRKGFCTLDDHPLEECPFAENYFDLAVMINVLDHVQDAKLCMMNLCKMVKTGGLIVIGQDLSNEEDIKNSIGSKGATGHPIKLNHEWMEKFIRNKFEPIIDKILPRELGRNPEGHYGTYLFAGKKLAQ